jgi:hypothetical protein
MRKYKGTKKSLESTNRLSCRPDMPDSENMIDNRRKLAERNREAST